LKLFKYVASILLGFHLYHKLNLF